MDHIYFYSVFISMPDTTELTLTKYFLKRGGRESEREDRKRRKREERNESRAVF